jgi:nitrite reductase/ring-hydroxylating ferredoxin subunit
VCGLERLGQRTADDHLAADHLGALDIKLAQLRADKPHDRCLHCPCHAALYDVGTGAILRGPQGAFKPLAGAAKATTGARSSPSRSRCATCAIWLVG